ncbi:MAG: DUF3263 domain-containing protein [Candidatus Nanopelagicales bacterium]
MNREAMELADVEVVDLREVDLRDGVRREELSDLELRILEFEHRWYRHRGEKHVDLSREFGISPIRYFQILNHIIDKPAAVVAEPMLVNRLRRLRDSRRRMHGSVRMVLSA